MWTLLNAQQRDVVPQVPLLPAIRVGNQPGDRLTGMDEAAAINHENQQEASQDGPHLARVPLGSAGIGKIKIIASDSCRGVLECVCGALYYWKQKLSKREESMNSYFLSG